MSILRIGQHYTSGKQNKQVENPHQHATHHHSRLRRTKDDGEYKTLGFHVPCGGHGFNKWNSVISLARALLLLTNPPSAYLVRNGVDLCGGKRMRINETMTKNAHSFTYPMPADHLRMTHISTRRLAKEQKSHQIVPVVLREITKQ